MAANDPTLCIPIAAIAERHAAIANAANAQLGRDLGAIVSAYARHIGFELFASMLSQIRPVPHEISEIELVNKRFSLFAAKGYLARTIRLTVRVNYNEVWHTVQVSIEELWDYMCGEESVGALYHKRVWPSLAPLFMRDLRSRFAQAVTHAVAQN